MQQTKDRVVDLLIGRERGGIKSQCIDSFVAHHDLAVAVGEDAAGGTDILLMGNGGGGALQTFLAVDHLCVKKNGKEAQQAEEKKQKQDNNALGKLFCVHGNSFPGAVLLPLD